MLNGIEAVLFDLDGTLVDSMWMWKQIDIEYLNMKQVEMPKDLQRSIEGRSFYETAVYFRERFNLKDSLEEIMACWNEMARVKYANEVFLKKGVRSFLDHLREKKIKTGIATSNSLLLTETALEANNIRDYFDVIIPGHRDINGKPAPDVYLLAAKKLNIRPEKCLVFEDLKAGIQAGRAAGMKVCAVHDDFSLYQEDEKRRLADYYIYDYSGITNGDYEVLD
ncbi:MAG: HAD family phosphatase [Lachnospiraceae bacterium]|nr:HAD family phosphatase [Lachnospiraceae bacterium]